MNKLYIDNETDYDFKYTKLFKKIFKLVVKSEKIKGVTETSLIIVDNKKIKTISNKYRKVDKPTDVLSFPGDWKELYPLINKNILGDIFISFEMILEQSASYNHSDQREWSYIFAHGLYHLLGYNHVKKDQEKIMNKKVEAIMELVKVGRNA